MHFPTGFCWLRRFRCVCLLLFLYLSNCPNSLLLLLHFYFLGGAFNFLLFRFLLIFHSSIFRYFRFGFILCLFLIRSFSFYDSLARLLVRGLLIRLYLGRSFGLFNRGLLFGLCLLLFLFLCLLYFLHRSFLARFFFFLFLSFRLGFFLCGADQLRFQRLLFWFLCLDFLDRLFLFLILFRLLFLCLIVTFDAALSLLS